MSNRSPDNDGISPKFWIGAVIVVVIAVFIGLNREDATVSFGLFDAETSLWVALTIAAAGGFIAGWLMGRRRR
jgi:lipopolysaccharide assembly protein A